MSNDKINLLNLIKDEGLKNLSYKLGKPNLFELIGLQSQEIRHSVFLNELLNPFSKVDTGHLVLRDLIREALRSIEKDQDAMKVNNFDPFEFEFGDTDGIEFHLERDHMDIVILNHKKGYVIVVENKVKAAERKNQLKDYRNKIEEEFPSYKKLFIFLTPEGREPSTDDCWTYASYRAIHSSISDICGQGRSSETTLFLLKHYKELLEKYVLNQEELELLANRIYKEHKEAIDFIWEKKADGYLELSNKIRELIAQDEKLSCFNAQKSTKTYVRYETAAMSELRALSPNTNNGWAENNSGQSPTMVWEIEIRQDSVRCALVLGPSRNQEGRAKLKEALLEKFGSKARGASSEYTRVKTLSLTTFNKDDFDVDKIAADVLNKFTSKVGKHADMYDDLIREAAKVFK